MGIRHIRTKTHDYVRHGTLTLFAALNYLDGKLISHLAVRHRHQEWLVVLKLIDQQNLPDLDTSWMNLVERFFGELTPFIGEKSFCFDA